MREINPNQEPRIPIKLCVEGRVYRISSRNLSFGVYDGNEGFIGIREKFSARYLFTEYHWDQGPPYGTVSSQVDTGIDLPQGIKLREHLRTVDKISGREVEFDEPIGDGGRGWYFVDTGESSPEIHPVAVENRALFEFLESLDL